MKKILLICFLLIGIASVSFAQSGHKLTTEQKIKQLQKQLKLSEKQTATISAIYKAATVKLDSIISASHGNQTETMKAMHPLGEATDKKIKAVLNVKQAKAFDKLRKESIAKTGNGWTAS
jgi:Spy/CpxP family protein refolding chaperone